MKKKISSSLFNSSASNRAKALNKLTILFGSIGLGSHAFCQTTLYWGGGADPHTLSINDSATAAGSTAGANLNGAWGTGIGSVTANWNADPNSTSGFSGWTNGSIAVFRLINNTSTGTNNSGSTITLNENIEVAGILADYQRSPGGMTNKTFNVNGTGIITVLAGAVLGSNYTTGGNGLTINNSLAGTHGLTPSGGVNLGGANTISGDVRINTGNSLGVTNNGSLLNIDSFDVGVKGQLSVNNLISGNGSNSIKDTATITLNNARFNLVNGQNDSSETVSSIVLEGSGFISISDRRTLTLTDGFDRGSNQLGVMSSTGSDTFGTTTLLKSGTQSNTGTLPWAIRTANNDVRFLSVDSAGVFQNQARIEAPKALDTWTYNDATANVQLITAAIGDVTGAFAQNITVDTLALGASTNATLALDFSGNTLTTRAVAGAISGDRNAFYNVGAASLADKITSPNGELYVIHDRNGNSALGSSLTLRAAVVDNGVTPVNLILGGAQGKISLSAANTHTGKTHINAEEVTLSSSGRLLTTSELNISRESLFISGSAAGNIWGGGAVEQTLSGGGTYRANTSTVVIGAEGAVVPGNFGAGESLTFNFSGAGKLQFDLGSTVALGLGQESDSIDFTTLGDWLRGSENFTLDLSSETGFANGNAYTVFNNVTTSGFLPGSVSLDGNVLTSGTDYTWDFAGNAYTFTAVPEPSNFVLGMVSISLCLLRRRKTV